MTVKKYTVGQIADLCDISKKQLRYYDQIGLLVPEYRDVMTSYRYYTDNQIEEVLLIKELRRLNISLDNIGKLLAKRNITQLQAVLQEQLSVLRAEISRQQRQYDQVIDALIRIMQSSSLAFEQYRQDIKLVSFPEKMVCFTRYVSASNANKLFINRRAELIKICEACGIHIIGPNYAIFHSDYIEQFAEKDKEVYSDLEVCYEFADTQPSASGAKYIRTIPSFKAVSCLHFGHYRDMMPTYRSIECWAMKNGLELSSASIEEYLVGATNTSNPNDYITKLYIPLKGSIL